MMKPVMRPLIGAGKNRPPSFTHLMTMMASPGKGRSDWNSSSNIRHWMSLLCRSVEEYSLAASAVRSKGDKPE